MYIKLVQFESSLLQVIYLQLSFFVNLMRIMGYITLHLPTALYRMHLSSAEKPSDDSNPNSDLTEDSADRHNDPESKNNSQLDTISKEADDDKAMGIVPVSPPVAPTWLSADPVNGQTEKGQNKDLKENLELSEQAVSLRSVSCVN